MVPETPRTRGGLAEREEISTFCLVIFFGLNLGWLVGFGVIIVGRGHGCSPASSPAAPGGGISVR